MVDSAAPATLHGERTHSRRALLAASLGGLAGMMASALGRVPAVEAAHGDVHLGATNITTGETKITNSSAYGPGFVGESNGGVGVWGRSETGTALQGRSDLGYALRAFGRIAFPYTSGVATIAAGTTARQVSISVPISPEAFVLLSPRDNIGSRALWYVPEPGTHNFKIRMSSAHAKPRRVAYLVVR